MLTTQSAVRKDKNAPHDVKLEHRHFAFIASVFAKSKPSETERGYYDQWRTDIAAFADACAATNPKFDRVRFLRACGVGE